MQRRWGPNRITESTESTGSLQSGLELGERLPRLNTREPLGRGPFAFYAGTYDPALKYFEQDIVKSGSSFYLCVQAHGPIPAHAVTELAFWIPFGGGGTGGGNMTFRGEFDVLTSYVVGDVVTVTAGLNSGLYWCRVATGSPGSPFGDPARLEEWVQLAPGGSLGNWY